uniref:Uncharacterized protein n=1 Tax=Cucumis melo TaxID=3656 RepID=A0A9I9CX69_CUCME
MGNWRRRHGSEIPHHHQLKSPRNPSPDNWHAGVPSWEKKFCSSVGLISWRKLLDTKKCMYLYDNVVKWNDSAGEEAFHNAKSRFWAEINGLPCDISLPDPDIYIDEIDWNCNVDPDLLLDLEREQIAPAVREGDVVIASLYEALGLYQSYTCVGWGEAKEDLQKPKAEPGNCDQKVDDGQNSWEMTSATKNNLVGMIGGIITLTTTVTITITITITKNQTIGLRIGFGEHVMRTAKTQVGIGTIHRHSRDQDFITMAIKRKMVGETAEEEEGRE